MKIFLVFSELEDFWYSLKKCRFKKNLVEQMMLKKYCQTASLPQENH
jgi:hypothetical protein